VSRSNRAADGDLEFLPPDGSAFGPLGGSDFVGFDTEDDDDAFDDPSSRSPWMRALAGVTVAGLLAVGIVAAAPWSDGASAPAPTTTPPSNVQAEDEVVADAVPPGLVIDHAKDFDLAGVYDAEVDPLAAAAFAQDRFELLATEGALHTSGRWLSVLTRRFPPAETKPDGVRLILNDQPALLVTSTDGVSELDFLARDGTSLRVAGYGFDVAELTVIAEQLTVGDGPVFDYGDLGRRLLNGMTPLVSRMVDSASLPALLPPRTSSAAYTGSVDRQSIVVGLIPLSTEDDHILELIGRPVTDMYRRNQAVLARMAQSGRIVTLRADPAAPQTLIASWPSPGGRVTVWSYGIAASDLIDLLPDVRPATDAEWSDLLVRTGHGDFTEPDEREPLRVVPSTTIGQSEAGNGSDDWTITMAAEPFSIAMSASTGTMGMGWAGDLDDIAGVPAIRRWASPTVTFVVATAGLKTDVRQVRITIEGRDPVVLPMVPLGESGVFAAGFAFTDSTGGVLEFLTEAGDAESAQVFGA
jgi:hypothetical protein